MSQRSHIAHSGSIAISACSAAWSVASSFGISLEPLELRRLGHEPDRLGREGRRRAVERHELDPLLRRGSSCARSRRPARSPRSRRRRARARAAAPRAAARRSRSRLLLRLRVPVAAERLDDRAHRVVWSSSRTRYDSPQVEVDGALVHGRVGARSLDERRAPRRSTPSTIVNDVGLGRAQRHARRRVVAAGPDEPARRLASARGRAAAAASASAPRIAASASSIGASNAAARTWPARTRGFAWSRIAASTRRPSSLSGSRMKYWSSASSLATSTASPCPRRPARPHCWRSDATVPGKPTEITASSSPMSIPSSSAFVAETPSSSPSASRRSISRRCCGRVAGAVRREPRVVAEPLGGEAVDQLRRLAALRERERAQAALDEPRLELRRLARAPSRAGRAPRRAAAGSRGRPSARRAAPRRRRSRSPARRAATRRARRGSRSSPRRAGTAGRSRRCARAAAAAAGRSRRASRRRRGRRAPRRRRRSGGSRARRPSGRGSAAAPTWSMSGLVRITFAHLRICQRCSVGVSPS